MHVDEQDPEVSVGRPTLSRVPFSPFVVRSGVATDVVVFAAVRLLAFPSVLHWCIFPNDNASEVFCVTWLTFQLQEEKIRAVST